MQSNSYEIECSEIVKLIFSKGCRRFAEAPGPNNLPYEECRNLNGLLFTRWGDVVLLVD